MPLACLPACLLAVLGVSTFAASAEASPDHADIHHVVSITEDAGNAAQCGIVNAHLTYLDSQGLSHVLDYRKFASNCQEGG